MTGSGVASSNSREFADARPSRSRAISMTAHCIPRQIPRNGTPLARVADRRDLPLDSAHAKPSRNQDPVDPRERPRRAASLDLLRVHPGEVHADVVREPAVRQRLDQALVGFLQLDVLPDQSDRHPPRPGALIPPHDHVPRGKVRSSDLSPRTLVTCVSSPSPWRTRGTS